MDNTGQIPPGSALYAPTMRGRSALIGLQGATVADLQTGGLPSRPWASEPSGDAPEIDIPNPLNPASAEGDNSYRPHPALPSADHLDYIHKLTSTSLLTIGLVLLVIVLLRNPRTGGGLLARGGLKQAGIA